MEPPSFPPSGLFTVRAAPGSDATLVLPLPAGTPPFSYQWSRAGASLDERFTVSDDAGGVRLTVTSARTGDTDVYTLQASNAAGSDTARVRLEVSADEAPTGDDPPTFLRRLQDLTVKVGTRTRFLVEIVSSTECKVTWYRNERRLLEAERVALARDGNFWCADVAAVSVDDAGRWTCTAENAGGRASCSAHLNVLVPKAYKRPEFVEELRALLTEQGTVSLECKVVGVPTPVLRWFKDSREIKAGDVFALTANAEDPTSLGTYTCEAVNCMGRAYSSSKVHVVGRGSREGSARPSSSSVTPEPPPIFTKELEDQFVRICEPLTLGCHIVVPPWPRSVVWYNKEGKIEPSERYHVLEDGAGGYLLEVPSAEWPDEGEWKCVATSSGGRVGISTCYVTMDVPKNYRKPRFMENLQAVLTEEGLVSFECKVVGFPTPVLSWFKDGQELKPGDVYQLTGTNSLGSYCCIARNCMGQASSSAELTVEDIQNQLNEEEKLQLFDRNQAPKFIQGLKSVEAKIDEPFRFTVKIAIPPEPSVLWYRDDQPVDESSRCHHGREDRGVFYLDIQSLEFLDQAEWKCVAMNDFGHSVTSCFLKLIIPRHYKKPRFLENLQAILSEEGAVNLECKVIGVPQPVLKWYKDGEELKPGDIHRIISGQDGTCCLGTYTCEAQNCMGIAASSASLLGFDDSMKAKKKKTEEQALQRNLSLSTIHEERTSQMYDTPVGDITTLDDKGEISFSFDGKEVSVSLYETPDLTEEEALQIVEMYADQLSENITEHNVVELPPLRFVKETSTSGNLLMEAVIIDVSPDYFVSPDEDMRTEADIEDISIADENGPPQLSLDQDIDTGGEDYLERTMALLSEEKSDIPLKPGRKKSDSQRSADDFYSLSRDQSLSLEKRDDDDTQPKSESEQVSFASAHSSGKPKSKSSKPSVEDGQESSEPTKTILYKDEATNLDSTEPTPVVKPKRERRTSRSSRRSSSGSEKSVSRTKEEILRIKESTEIETPKRPKMSDEEFKEKMTNVSASLSKVINDIQIIERDIILKSELMSSAATASRSLEIISSLISPLSEIHSIADAAKESAIESKEVSSTLFNSLPQPLKALQQSLTIIEKCIDMESDSKTLVKKTCVAFIETCGSEMQKIISDINAITCTDYLLTEDKVLTEIESLNNEMSAVIKFSNDNVKARNLLSKASEIKADEPSVEIKHLRDTQKAIFELKSPLNSLLCIAESADSGKLVDVAKVRNSEVLLNDMSASIQDLQMALEQIESLSVKESTTSLHKYNTQIIETVMESIVKLRSSFEQLSLDSVEEDKNALKQAITAIKENLNKISLQIELIENDVGTFDVLQSENKLDALQKMAQILITLENNLPRLEAMPEVKNHMSLFHKNLTKVLENVIESNESKKYFILMEICDAVNRINASIKNLDVENVMPLASLSNTLKIIQDKFISNVFDSELNCSLLTNIADTLVGIQEALNTAEEVSLQIDSEQMQEIANTAYDELKAKVIVEHIDLAIAAIENVKALESTNELKVKVTPSLVNISPVLEELKRNVASVKASSVEEEHVSELSEVSSFAQTLAAPLCELNQNLIVLNQQIVENIDSIKENREVLLTVAEPLHELHTTLEILQQDIISQYGEDITPYDVSINMASAVQNLQSCIVIIQEQAGVEAVDEMSTLEDISGIKTTADTITSDRLVLPVAEENIAEQIISPFSQEMQTTATAQALQTLNEHITVLQTPEIIDALDTLSEVSDYSSLKSFVVGLGELHSGIEEVLHPLLMEGSNEISNLINTSKLVAIAEPMQELQQSLSVLDTSNIPIYENILEMPAEKIHSVIQSVSEFKDHLDKCMLAVFPALQTADNTVEIANKVGSLREACENLKDIIKTTKVIEDIPVPEKVNALEMTVNSLLDATDVSKGIKIDEVKFITEELYEKVATVQEEMLQFIPQSPDKIAQEAKLIQTIDLVQNNIAVLEQYDFVDLSRASDLICVSPQVAAEIESESLVLIEDIVDSAVNVVQDSSQDMPIADLMIVEDFFKTCKNEFTILRCLMSKATSHKKIIRLLQEFNSLQNTINDFKTKRSGLTLTDDVNGCLATFLIHADDCLQNVQTSLTKIINSQADLLIEGPLAKFENSTAILKTVKEDKHNEQITETINKFIEILEVAKPNLKMIKHNILNEIQSGTSSLVEDITLTNLINDFSTFIEQTKLQNKDVTANDILEKVSTCIEKHQEYKDASGTGKTLIILKCLSDCTDLLQESVSKVKVPKQKIEEGPLKAALTEMLEPLQALHSQLINVQEQVLKGIDESSISVDISSTESLVQTMTEKHKEIMDKIDLDEAVASENISLMMAVDKEIHSIQDSLRSIENTQVLEAVKEIAKPVEEIEKSLKSILSTKKTSIYEEDIIPKDVNSNIDSLENAIDRFLNIDINSLVSSNTLCEADLNEGLQLANELQEILALNPEDIACWKTSDYKKKNIRLLKDILSKFDWQRTDVYDGKNQLEIDEMKCIFLTTYQLLTELNKEIVLDNKEVTEEKSKQIVSHIDQYIELIEIVEEISAIIKIEDVKGTMDIAKELRESIVASEVMVQEEISAEKIIEHRKEQAKLAQKLQTALSALQVQVLDSAQELAPALSADVLQRIARVTAQLQADLIVVTGIGVALQAPAETITLDTLPVEKLEGQSSSVTEPELVSTPLSSEPTILQQPGIIKPMPSFEQLNTTTEQFEKLVAESKEVYLSESTKQLTDTKTKQESVSVQTVEAVAIEGIETTVIEQTETVSAGIVSEEDAILPSESADQAHDVAYKQTLQTESVSAVIVEDLGPVPHEVKCDEGPRDVEIYQTAQLQDIPRATIDLLVQRIDQFMSDDITEIINEISNLTNVEVLKQSINIAKELRENIATSEEILKAEATDVLQDKVSLQQANLVQKLYSALGTLQNIPLDSLSEIPSIEKDKLKNFVESIETLRNNLEMVSIQQISQIHEVKPDTPDNHTSGLIEELNIVDTTTNLSKGELAEVEHQFTEIQPTETTEGKSVENVQRESAIFAELQLVSKETTKATETEKVAVSVDTEPISLEKVIESNVKGVNVEKAILKTEEPFAKATIETLLQNINEFLSDSNVQIIHKIFHTLNVDKNTDLIDYAHKLLQSLTVTQSLSTDPNPSKEEIVYDQLLVEKLQRALTILLMSVLNSAEKLNIIPQEELQQVTEVSNSLLTQLAAVKPQVLVQQFSTLVNKDNKSIDVKTFTKSEIDLLYTSDTLPEIHKEIMPNVDNIHIIEMLSSDNKSLVSTNIDTTDAENYLNEDVQDQEVKINIRNVSKETVIDPVQHIPYTSETDITDAKSKSAESLVEANAAVFYTGDLNAADLDKQLIERQETENSVPISIEHPEEKAIEEHVIKNITTENIISEIAGKGIMNAETLMKSTEREQHMSNKAYIDKISTQILGETATITELVTEELIDPLRDNNVSNANISHLIENVSEIPLASTTQTHLLQDKKSSETTVEQITEKDAVITPGKNDDKLSITNEKESTLHGQESIPVKTTMIKLNAEHVDNVTNIVEKSIKLEGNTAVDNLTQDANLLGTTIKVFDIPVCEDIVEVLQQGPHKFDIVSLQDLAKEIVNFTVAVAEEKARILEEGIPDSTKELNNDVMPIPEKESELKQTQIQEIIQTASEISEVAEGTDIEALKRKLLDSAVSIQHISEESHIAPTTETTLGDLEFIDPSFVNTQNNLAILENLALEQDKSLLETSSVDQLMGETGVSAPEKEVCSTGITSNNIQNNALDSVELLCPITNEQAIEKQQDKETSNIVIGEVVTSLYENTVKEFEIPSDTTIKVSGVLTTISTDAENKVIEPVSEACDIISKNESVASIAVSDVILETVSLDQGNDVILNSELESISIIPVEQDTETSKYDNLQTATTVLVDHTQVKVTPTLVEGAQQIHLEKEDNEIPQMLGIENLSNDSLIIKEVQSSEEKTDENRIGLEGCEGSPKCEEHLVTPIVHTTDSKLYLEDLSSPPQKTANSTIEQGSLIEHIEEFTSDEITKLVENISTLTNAQELKETIQLAKVLKESIEFAAVTEKSDLLKEVKLDQAVVAQKLLHALLTLHTKVLESATEIAPAVEPDTLQKVSEIISHLQEDLETAIIVGVPEIKTDVITQTQEKEEDSMKQLEILLQEVTDKINLPTDRDVEDTEALRDALDEVQTVIIKLKRDYDGAADDTLNETLEDLECSVRSVQLQINEDSPSELLKDACATLQLLVNNMSETQDVRIETVIKEQDNESILRKCATESDETVQMLESASKIDANDENLSGIILSLTILKDTVKSLKLSFVSDADMLIEKGVDVVQTLDQLEDKVFALEKDLCDTNLNIETRDNILTAVHSVYGSISNMRGTISSIQKRFMFENYGKPSETILRSIKNITSVSNYVDSDKQNWKKFSNSLRKMLNHFEDIKFYINLDKTARLPSDAAFTKIILEELKTNIGEVLVPQASILSPDVVQMVNNLLQCVNKNLANIESKSTLEVKEKIPIFKDLSSEILNLTEVIKDKMTENLNESNQLEIKQDESELSHKITKAVIDDKKTGIDLKPDPTNERDRADIDEGSEATEILRLGDATTSQTYQDVKRKVHKQVMIEEIDEQAEIEQVASELVAEITSKAVIAIQQLGELDILATASKVSQSMTEIVEVEELPESISKKFELADKSEECQTLEDDLMTDKPSQRSVVDVTETTQVTLIEEKLVEPCNTQTQVQQAEKLEEYTSGEKEPSLVLASNPEMLELQTTELEVYEQLVAAEKSRNLYEDKTEIITKIEDDKNNMIKPSTSKEADNQITEDSFEIKNQLIEEKEKEDHETISLEKIKDKCQETADANEQNKEFKKRKEPEVEAEVENEKEEAKLVAEKRLLEELEIQENKESEKRRQIELEANKNKEDAEKEELQKIEAKTVKEKDEGQKLKAGTRHSEDSNTQTMKDQELDRQVTEEAKAKDKKDAENEEEQEVKTKTEKRKNQTEKKHKEAVEGKLKEEEKVAEKNEKQEEEVKLKKDKEEGENFESEKRCLEENELKLKSEKDKLGKKIKENAETKSMKEKEDTEKGEQQEKEVEAMREKVEVEELDAKKGYLEEAKAQESKETKAEMQKEQEENKLKEETEATATKNKEEIQEAEDNVKKEQAEIKPIEEAEAKVKSEKDQAEKKQKEEIVAKTNQEDAEKTEKQEAEAKAKNQREEVEKKLKEEAKAKEKKDKDEAEKKEQQKAKAKAKKEKEQVQKKLEEEAEAKAKKEKEEAENKEKQETEAKAKKDKGQTEQKLREEAESIEKKDIEEAEKKDKQEAEAKANKEKEQAEKKIKEEAEAKAKNEKELAKKALNEEAEERAKKEEEEAEKKGKQEAEAKAKKEKGQSENKLKEEAEAKAKKEKEEAETKEKQEAEAKAKKEKEQTDMKLKEQAEAKAKKEKEEAEKKEKQEAEAKAKKDKEEAEKKEKQEAEAKAKKDEEQAEKIMKEEAETKVKMEKEEAEKKEKQETEAKAKKDKEQAEMKLKEEAEAKAKKEKEEAEKLKKQEAEAEAKKEKEQAEKKLKEEAEAKAKKEKEEAEKKEKQEAEAKAKKDKEQAEMKLKEEAEAKAKKEKKEAEKKEKQEAEAKAKKDKEQAEMKLKEEAEAKAKKDKEEAEKLKKQEAEAEAKKEKEQAEMKLKEEAEAKAKKEKEEAEKKEKQEAEAKAKKDKEQAEMKLKEEAEAKAKKDKEEAEKLKKQEAEAEAKKEKEQAEKKLKEEAEAKAKKEKEEAEKKEKQEAEAKAKKDKEQAEMKLKEEAETKAKKDKEEAEKLKKQEAEAEAKKEKEQAEKKLKEEAEAKAKKEKEEAEKKEKQEAEAKSKKDKEQAEMKLKEEAEAKAKKDKEEAEKLKKQEAEAEAKKEKEQAEKKLKEEDEAKAKKEKEKAEKLKKQEAEAEAKKEKEQAEKKLKEEAEGKAKKEKEEAEKKEKQEAEAKAKKDKEQAEMKLKEEAEAKAKKEKEEAEKKEKQEAEAKAKKDKEQAEMKLKEEAEAKAKKDKEEAEKLKKQEAEAEAKKEKEQAEKKLKEEAEAKAKKEKEEAEKKEKQEAEAKAKKDKEQAEMKLKEEAETKAKKEKEEAEKKEKQEAEAKAKKEKEQAEKKLKEEAEAKAKKEKEEAEKKEKQEAEAKAKKDKEQAEKKLKEEAEAIAKKEKEEAEKKEKQEAEAKAKKEKEQAEKKLKDEAEAKAKKEKEEAERKEKQEAEAKAKKDKKRAEEKLKEEAEMKAKKEKEEAEKKEKQEAESKAKKEKEQTEMKLKEEAEAKAKKEKEEAEKKEKQEVEAKTTEEKEQAEKKLKEEAETKAKKDKEEAEKKDKLEASKAKKLEEEGESKAKKVMANVEKEVDVNNQKRGQTEANITEDEEVSSMKRKEKTKAKAKKAVDENDEFEKKRKMKEVKSRREKEEAEALEEKLEQETKQKEENEKVRKEEEYQISLQKQKEENLKQEELREKRKHEKLKLEEKFRNEEEEERARQEKKKTLKKKKEEEEARLQKESEIAEKARREANKQKKEEEKLRILKEKEEVEARENEMRETERKLRQERRREIENDLLGNKTQSEVETESKSKYHREENGDISKNRIIYGEDHYIKEYQYEPSRNKNDERKKFVDHSHKDYTMEFLKPSNYRERSFEHEKYTERETLGRSATIYKAQTLILDSQLRSSAPPQQDRIETERRLEKYRDDRSESERRVERHRKALSEARSMVSEKRSGLTRDLKRKPVFSTYLTDRTAVEGSRVKLTCSVLSSTDPKITWYKNGVILDNKLKYRTKFIDGLITLEVLNAVVSDSAEYSCTVENENGSISTSANLKVYPSFEASPIPPTFTRSIRDTYHLAENELVLECRIRGQPLPTITWLKDDKIVTNNERYQAYYLADGVCRLAISHPTPEDSGKYTCKAENSVWSDQITHVVSFTGKESHLSPNITTIERSRFNRQALESRRPHFTNVLTDYKVAKGGTIGLQVEIKGCPTRVEWLREGRSVTEVYRNARTFVEQGLYTLALSDVTEKESGMYTCRAWSTHGNVDMNAAITVVPPNEMEGKPAIIVGRPDKDILISVGEDVNISFRVQGEPKPKVVFMKGIRDITTNQRVCKMTSDDYVKFTLKRSVVSDAGTYCILARNAYGCDRAFVTVEVRQRASSDNLISDWTYPMDDAAHSIAERKYKSVPDRIPGEPSVVDGGNNWVSLAWPKADPRDTAPVLAYKIESWLIGKEGGARWVELGITPLNSFDAFNLKQGEEYHFRVTPRNRYGWGESVQTSSPIGIGLAGDRPEFVEILPGQLKVLVGETANLSCSVKGKPVPEVVWMKNGHEIEEEGRMTTAFNGQDCSLTIKDICIEDEARYSCEATNVHGRASTYARLAVVTDRLIWEADAKLKRERSQDADGDYPPQFTMRLRDRRVQATYPVRLTCQVVGNPPPTVTWFKDGELLVFDSRRTNYQDEHFHTLEIAPTSLEDGGVYEAMARNSSGAVSCRCSLVVDKGIRAYVAPEFCCGLEPLYRLSEGEELRISAVVEAYPSVGVTWYRDGVRLRPSRRAIMTLDRDGQIELALASVTARDAGVYTCTASNEVGRASTSGKVEVMEGDQPREKRTPPVLIHAPDVPYSKEPMFVRKPRSSEAREGDTVIIACEVIGDPKPDVYWLRDFLKPDYYRDATHFKRVGDGPEYRFEIPHAKLDYTGAYSVVARNVHGEAKAIISLQILAKDPSSSDDSHNVRYGRVDVIPRFERQLTDLLSYDGDAVEFECHVTGNPEPDIRWFHYNELIRDCQDFETSFQDGAVRLKIKQVTAEDEGTYSCEASNNLGKATSSACLVVYPPGEPNLLRQRLRRPPELLSSSSTPRSTPRSTPARSVSRGPDPRRLCSPSRQMAPSFYTYPFNKVVEEGDHVTFKCAVKGLPAPWATWDKDGIIITPSSRITIREKDELLRILEIEQVSIEDVGIYRITVENEFGRAEASARLEVITQKGKFYGGVRAYSASPRKSLTFRRYPSVPKQD